MMDNLSGLKERLAQQNIQVEQFDIDLMNRQSGDPFDRSDGNSSKAQNSDEQTPGESSNRESSDDEKSDPETVKVNNNGQLDVVI